MALVDMERYREGVNSDDEFRMAARFWSAAIRVEMGSETYFFRLQDGKLISAAPPSGASVATDIRDYDLEISAPEEEWSKYLEDVPAPFYHELWAAVSRHNFRHGGNMKMWFAYYPALRRMFEIMRSYKLEKA